MASSSVSQDDFEKNDFEKLERRSRIRTARARQINPQVKAAPNITIPNVDHNDIGEMDHIVVVNNWKYDVIVKL